MIPPNFKKFLGLRIDIRDPRGLIILVENILGNFISESFFVEVEETVAVVFFEFVVRVEYVVDGSDVC